MFRLQWVILKEKIVLKHMKGYINFVTVNNRIVYELLRVFKHFLGSRWLIED